LGYSERAVCANCTGGGGTMPCLIPPSGERVRHETKPRSFQARCFTKERAPTEADAHGSSLKSLAYIFFSEHVLVAASHMPPAFLQSASVLAAVAPAKAGPAKANARATASVEIRAFRGFSLYARLWGPSA
jgi:hypothetical protein